MGMVGIVAAEPSRTGEGIEMTGSGSTAVVLGAGMAGLLTAGVLSEFYESVTVIDRDRLPDRPDQRRGVPQGRHLHSLLCRGTQVVDQLLPGLLDRLGAAGAVVAADDDLSQTYVRVGGHELNRTGRLTDPAALVTYQCSRPFLEFHLRQHLSARDGVTIVGGHEVDGLVATGDAVTGVRITSRGNRITTVLSADLVVDALGRATRTPDFLTEHGFGAPPPQQVPTTRGYSSQLLRISVGRITERMAYVDQGRGADGVLMLAYENDTWMLAIARNTDRGAPPADFAELLAVAESILPPAITAVLREAEPVGDIAVCRNTAAVWRRYDRMERSPVGLLVIGDALCTLNPLHGQGMTMAALQALALRDCLRDGGDRDLPRRFFTAAADHLRGIWTMNAAADRAPSTDRPQPLRRRFRTWVATSALKAAADDTAVAERLVRVRNLVDPPARLRDPALLWRILRANLRRPAATM